MKKNSNIILRISDQTLDSVLGGAANFIREAPSERIEQAMPRLTNAEAAGRDHLMRGHARLEQERVPVDEWDLFPDPIAV